MKTFKTILKCKWYVVISPPSLYLTHKMTLKEAKEFVNEMISYGNHNHIIVRHIFGNFSKNYPMVYPVNGLVLKS